LFLRYQARNSALRPLWRAPSAEGETGMQIANETAVFIHYTLKNSAGDIVDSSEGSEPLAYIHGRGDIVPGLERALSGRNPGEKFEVAVSPADGYGVHRADRVQSVPRSAFDPKAEIKPGMRFQAQNEGGLMVVTVIDVSDTEVTVDGNHPLAGEMLNFAIEVVNVRAATQEELEHGHIHGEGGHHH
jgi:FKBP-type peptidyl-prolyl cis-trans isomerase SlyD